MDWFNDYGYGYGYDGSGGLPGGMDFWAMVIGFMLIFVLVVLALQLTLYILRSIGLYGLASNRGMSGAGLAWIPFIGFYRIGSIADDISARTGTRSYYRYILLIGSILSFILSSVHNRMLYPSISGFFSGFRYGYFGHGLSSPMLSSVSVLTFIVSLTVFVVMVISLNRIYKCYRPASSTLWTVLSVIFPFMQSIFLFVIRNAVPVIEFGAGVYYPVQNQNWQAPPQYPPYGQPPPADDRYFQLGYGQGQPPPPQYISDASYKPPGAAPIEPPYQPPAAPNPPQPWELDSPPPPPPQAPWEKDDG